MIVVVVVVMECCVTTIRIIIVEPGGPRRVALVLHWLPLQRLRCLFLGYWIRATTCSFGVVALALHWLAIQRIWLLAPMLEFHFLRLLCLSGGATQNDKTFG